jgi:hypothetical protein
MTVPGVGPVAALSYNIGVDDPGALRDRERSVGCWADVETTSVRELYPP